MELKTKNLNKSQKIERINKYCNDIKLSYDNKVVMMQRQLRQKTDDINKKEILKETIIKILENKNNNSLINDNKLKNWIKINKVKKLKINIPKINIESNNISRNNISIKSTREKKSKIGKNSSNQICKTQRIKNLKKKI